MIYLPHFSWPGTGRTSKGSSKRRRRRRWRRGKHDLPHCGRDITRHAMTLFFILFYAAAWPSVLFYDCFGSFHKREERAGKTT
jgi:hypothetical protein